MQIMKLNCELGKLVCKYKVNCMEIMVLIFFCWGHNRLENYRFWNKEKYSALRNSCQ